MSKYFLSFIGSLYNNIPKDYRPYVKAVVYWCIIRVRSTVLLRRLYSGTKVEFLDFEIANLEAYEFLGPNKNQILVEVHNSLISPGTEKAVLCGLPGARRAFPYTPGYSVAGEVAKIGKKTNSFKVGDRVAGRISHSSHGTVDPKLLFKIPDNVSAVEACFIELGIITLQGIRKASIKPGDRVVVLGQGLIGQLSNKIVRLVGASHVTAIAHSCNRQKTALGPDSADEFIALSEQKVGIKSLKADVVIEAVGSPQAVTVAMECAKDGGKVVLLGSSRGLGREIDVYEGIQRRNLKLIGAHIGALPSKDNSSGRWTYKQEGKLFLELLKSKRLKVSDLVTWKAEPDQCNLIYEKLAEGGKEHVGIVINWKHT